MQNKILILLTGLAAAMLLTLAPLRAEPAVEVKSATEVRVDGVNLGKPVDAAVNTPALAVAIQLALIEWAAGVEREKAAALAAQAETQALAARLIAQAKTALAAHDTVALARIIAEAETPAAERKKAALQEQIEKLQAQKEALGN